MHPNSRRLPDAPTMACPSCNHSGMSAGTSACPACGTTLARKTGDFQRPNSREPARWKSPTRNRGFRKAVNTDALMQRSVTAGLSDDEGMPAAAHTRRAHPSMIRSALDEAHERANAPMTACRPSIKRREALKAEALWEEPAAEAPMWEKDDTDAVEAEAAEPSVIVVDHKETVQVSTLDSKRILAAAQAEVRAYDVDEVPFGSGAARWEFGLSLTMVAVAVGLIVHMLV
jgi:hypothetical protein